MYIDESRDINIDNNVFFRAERQIVYVGLVREYTFTNNLLVLAEKRTEISAMLVLTKLTEDVACYEQYKELISPKTDNVLVKNNLAQGS